MRSHAARILVVDDHPLICLAVERLLAGEPDMEVCGTAGDVAEALRQVKALAPDLAVVDISLRSGNGIELIKRIRAQHSAVMVLVLSMHDESLFAERALHAGAQGYLHKQQAAGELTVAIRDVLAGHIHLSAEMTDNLLHRVSGHSVGAERIADGVSVEQLSDREMEVFERMGEGLTTREIAERLHISVKTVETHRAQIMDRLGISDVAGLVRFAIRVGLIEAEP